MASVVHDEGADSRSGQGADGAGVVTGKEGDRHIGAAVAALQDCLVWARRASLGAAGAALRVSRHLNRSRKIHRYPVSTMWGCSMGLMYEMSVANVKQRQPLCVSCSHARTKSTVPREQNESYGDVLSD